MLKFVNLKDILLRVRHHYTFVDSASQNYLCKKPMVTHFCCTVVVWVHEVNKDILRTGLEVSTLLVAD